MKHRLLPHFLKEKLSKEGHAQQTVAVLFGCVLENG